MHDSKLIQTIPQTKDDAAVRGFGKNGDSETKHVYITKRYRNTYIYQTIPESPECCDGRFPSFSFLESFHFAWNCGNTRRSAALRVSLEDTCWSGQRKRFLRARWRREGFWGLRHQGGKPKGEGVMYHTIVADDWARIRTLRNRKRIIKLCRLTTGHKTRIPQTLWLTGGRRGTVYKRREQGATATVAPQVCQTGCRAPKKRTKTPFTQGELLGIPLLIQWSLDSNHRPVRNRLISSLLVDICLNFILYFYSISQVSFWRILHVHIWTQIWMSVKNYVGFNPTT